MSGNRLINQSFLRTDPSKAWIQQRVVQLIASESSVPCFSTAALKLTALLQKEDVDLEQVATVLALDPGLATRCLRVARSVGFGGHNVTSIQEAVLVIGLNEVRRIALMVGVMNNFSHLRVKVDWNRFWLHNVLVARLTERLAGGFREADGMDYMAGLLHDVGKLVIQHYFPREFEQIVIRSQERRCGHAPVEKDVLGLDHAQIGAAICDVLRLPPKLVFGVLNHHQALHPSSLELPEGDGGFLACCISVADTMTNLGSLNLEGYKSAPESIEELPEWKYLNENFSCSGLKLDLEEEIESANSDLAVLA